MTVVTELGSAPSPARSTSTVATRRSRRSARRCRPGFACATRRGDGVACVGADDDLASAASSLAGKTSSDQRGCLSPRVVFVFGGEERASRFACALHEALGAFEARAPRGAIDARDADAARYADTLRFSGELFEGAAHRVGVARELLLPPPGRHVHVVPVDDGEVLTRLLPPLEPAVTAIGGSSDACEAMRAFVRRPDRIRWSELGRMQRPALDGPVDRRPW